jgi:hypothetical protein
MSMSTSIRGFIPDTDPEYQRHKKVLLACKEAKVSLPEETAKYFGSKYPDLCLLEEKLEVNLVNGTHYKEYRAEMQEGFEVDLTKLPQGVTKIRFYNSY